MIQWCKARYHEAFEEYKLDTRSKISDPASIAGDIAEVQVWEEILAYLTDDPKWLE